VSGDRRTALRERIAALTDDARLALAGAIAADRRNGSPEQLTAYVVLGNDIVGAAEALPADEDLRTFVGQRLPAYMVPARYAVLERLPRTAAGKLDRRALAREKGTPLVSGEPASIVAPRTPLESTLAAIWRDVLRVDEISIHDDFFEIGGDSLLSIRAIARAGREGIRIPIEQFFDTPTIGGLAAALGDDLTSSAPVHPAADRGEQDVVVGEAPLTPIQHWFLDAIPDHRDHWNQSYLLEIAPTVERQAVEEAIRRLVAYHDALRLRLVQRHGEWRQEFRPATASAPLRTVELAAAEPAAYAERIASECDREHAAMRIDEGPLFRCIYFEAAGRWRRLVMIAHHIVVDAVSWHILFDDLGILLRSASANAALQLPAKTASARQWAIRLAELAGQPDIAEHASHWRRIAGSPLTPVPIDAPERAGGNTARDAEMCTVTIDVDESNRLLKAASQRLDATPQALLLSVLLLAWRDWTGQSELLLDVEGHGRDLLASTLDVSRTVGWFTTVFPMRLAVPGDPPHGAELEQSEVVQSVQSALAALPLRGASHGLLRWLSPDSTVQRALGSTERPEVLFNYLGARDSAVAADSPIGIASEAHGRARSPDGIRAYVLEINAYLESGRITFAVEYSRRLLRRESVQRFADALRRAVSSVTAARPARYPLAQVDASALSHVADLLAEIDDA
jgi:non-ribosomal peptide synthase protein (TIGR01720 family)